MMQEKENQTAPNMSAQQLLRSANAVLAAGRRSKALTPSASRSVLLRFALITNSLFAIILCVIDGGSLLCASVASSSPPRPRPGIHPFSRRVSSLAVVDHCVVPYSVVRERASRLRENLSDISRQLREQDETWERRRLAREERRQRLEQELQSEERNFSNLSSHADRRALRSTGSVAYGLSFSFNFPHFYHSVKGLTFC